MAEVSPDLQHQFGLMIGNIPETVRKAIDGEELLDRLVQADDLIRKSRQARTPGEGKQFGEQAQRILRARPRAETEQIVVAKMAKARIIGHKDQADQLVRQAREELLDHPPAVRRHGAPVAKAKAAAPEPDQLMAVYDQAGNLTHVGYPKDLTPVVSPDPGVSGMGEPRKTGPAAALPADGPQQALPGDVPGREVVKAAQKGRSRAASGGPAATAARATTPEQAIRSLGPKFMPVHDWTGRLAGAVPRSQVTPLPPGQVLKGAAASSRANVYDAGRRRVGTAPLAAIIELADLPGLRRR